MWQGNDVINTWPKGFIGHGCGPVVITHAFYLSDPSLHLDEVKAVDSFASFNIQDYVWATCSINSKHPHC